MKGAHTVLSRTEDTIYAEYLDFLYNAAAKKHTSQLVTWRSAFSEKQRNRKKISHPPHTTIGNDMIRLYSIGHAKVLLNFQIYK